MVHIRVWLKLNVRQTRRKSFGDISTKIGKSSKNVLKNSRKKIFDNDSSKVNFRTLSRNSFELSMRKKIDTEIEEVELLSKVTISSERNLVKWRSRLFNLPFWLERNSVPLVLSKTFLFDCQIDQSSIFVGVAVWWAIESSASLASRGKRLVPLYGKWRHTIPIARGFYLLD